MVTLTDIAAKKVGEFLSSQDQPEAGLRVAVKGGGCSGFQYQLAVTPNIGHWIPEEVGMLVDQAIRHIDNR